MHEDLHYWPQQQNTAMVIFNKRPTVRRGRRVGFLTCHNYPSKGFCSKEASVVWAPNCYLAFSKFPAVPTVPTPSSWRWKGISSAWLDSTANWQWQPWDMWPARYPFAFFSLSSHLSPLYRVSRLLSIFLSFTIPLLSIFVPRVSIIFFLFFCSLFICLFTKVKLHFTQAFKCNSDIVFGHNNSLPTFGGKLSHRPKILRAVCPCLGHDKYVRADSCKTM